MEKFLTVFTLLILTQVALCQLTIPMQRNCGCLEIPSTPNTNLVNFDYQNLAKQLAVGNMGGVLVSNGLPVINMPVTNAILDAMQVTKVPTTNNVQVPLAIMSGCQQNLAGVTLTPNNPRLNFGSIGSIANIGNGGGPGNIGLHFVPKSSTVNVPVRLRRNIQKNNMFHSSLCDSGIIDSTLLSL